MPDRMHVAGRWWETRWFALAAIALSVVPLLWPAYPPLVDMGEHIGRFHVMLNLARSPDLQRHWDYHWAPIGNLGVDLLVWPIGRMLGAELAAKLVVMAIPPLIVAGFLLVAREARGRIPPTAGFVFPLAYSYPFEMGFVNYTLAAALALWALAGWMGLGRARRIGLRAALSVPVALILWLAHSFGWGLFGVLAFTTDLVRRRKAGEGWWSVLVGALLCCLPLAVPVLLMANGGSGTGGLGISWEWIPKLVWIGSLLRERWMWFDAASMILLYALLLWFVLQRRNFGFDPLLGACALACLALFIALPRLLLGGAYVDMRILPFAIGFALLAIKVSDVGTQRALAIAGTAFFAIRMAATTAAFLSFAHADATALEATAAIPRGAAVLVLESEPCQASWQSARLAHVAGIAIARRDIFENGEWTLPGQQLLRDRHPEAGSYRSDPSQSFYPPGCEGHPNTLDEAIHGFNRATFTHVWTIGVPAYPRLAPDVSLVWSNGLSAVYVVARRTAGRTRP